MQRLVNRLGTKHGIPMKWRFNNIHRAFAYFFMLQNYPSTNITVKCDLSYSILESVVCYKIIPIASLGVMPLQGKFVLQKLS